MSKSHAPPSYTPPAPDPHEGTPAGVLIKALAAAKAGDDVSGVSPATPGADPAVTMWVHDAASRLGAPSCPPPIHVLELAVRLALAAEQ